MALLVTSRKSPRVVWPGWWPPLARWGLGAGVPPLVSFSAAWAASAARDSWYSRHFLSRFLSPADRFSFPGDALLLLPCSVRSSPGSQNFFSIMSGIETLIVAPDGYPLGSSSSSIPSGRSPSPGLSGRVQTLQRFWRKR